MFAPIQAYLRKSASRDRLTERIGPFLATISPHDANPYLNYAIPDDGAVPTAADAAALIAAYERHARQPRLEYIAELAPHAEPTLLAAGFTVEGRVPLMVYDPALARPAPQPEGIELIAPASDAEILDMASAQSEAYGGDGVPSANAVQYWRRFAAAGGISVSARETASGQSVGGGACDAPFDHTTELAGIGVRPVYRRRGIAGAMTTWLVERALAAGTTHVFLMAAGEAEARIYGRAGFRLVGAVLHISR